MHNGSSHNIWTKIKHSIQSLCILFKIRWQIKKKKKLLERRLMLTKQQHNKQKRPCSNCCDLLFSLLQADGKRGLILVWKRHFGLGETSLTTGLPLFFIFLLIYLSKLFLTQSKMSTSIVIEQDLRCFVPFTTKE